MSFIGCGAMQPFEASFTCRGNRRAPRRLRAAAAERHCTAADASRVERRVRARPTGRGRPSRAPRRQRDRNDRPAVPLWWSATRGIRLQRAGRVRLEPRRHLLAADGARAAARGCARAAERPQGGRSRVHASAGQGSARGRRPRCATLCPRAGNRRTRAHRLARAGALFDGILERAASRRCARSTVTPAVTRPAATRPAATRPTATRPAVDTPRRDTPHRDTPHRDTPHRDTPRRDTPTVDTHHRDRLRRDTPHRDTPTVIRPVTRSTVTRSAVTHWPIIGINNLQGNRR